MSFVKSFIQTTLILTGVGIGAAATVIYFGLVHPGANEPHSAVVYSLIETVRDRAIAVRAAGVIVPALGDPAQVSSGAGNYAAMCTSCHLAPGMAPTELSQGLYPAAPTLATVGAPDPARAFWVIKHGIKASGMPAWGKSMDDAYLWGLVAFLQKLPELSPAQYQQLVASSAGHSHGGGENMPHVDTQAGQEAMDGMDHGEVEVAPHDHAGSAPHEHAPAPPAKPEPTTHVHADGKPHLHDAAPAPEKVEASEHDDHDGH